MTAAARVRMLFAGDDCAILEALGREVDLVGHARNAEEARALTADLAPDVVLLDLEAPAIGGAAAIGTLRERPGSPIVFVLTDRDTPVARSESFAAGADGFIVKSEPERLRFLIAKLRPHS